MPGRSVKPLLMGLIGRTNYLSNEIYTSLWKETVWDPCVDIGALFYIVLQMQGHTLYNMKRAAIAYEEEKSKPTSLRTFLGVQRSSDPTGVITR